MLFAIIVGVIVAILFLAISFSFLGKEANKIVEKKNGSDQKYHYGSTYSNHIESEDYYEHTFRNTVFGTVVVKSQYETEHLNPIMSMLELTYDTRLDSIWYGGSKNKEEFYKLKSYYLEDKTTFKKVYTEHAEAVIEILNKDIAEQERSVEYWTGDID